MKRRVYDLPGRPLVLWVPTEVKKRPLVFFLFDLLWSHARPVFSPTLNTYFAESKVTTIVGSVSVDSPDSTEVDHLDTAMSWKERRLGYIQRLRKHSPRIAASLLSAESRKVTRGPTANLISTSHPLPSLTLTYCRSSRLLSFVYQICDQPWRHRTKCFVTTS